MSQNEGQEAGDEGETMGVADGGRSQQGQFPIVGVGASAGGLEALEKFFDHLPSDTGMAFVVIQHLSPDYKSLMAELLSKHTKMKVMRAEDGLPVERDEVYLIPPKKTLRIFNGRLLLEEQESRGGLNLPIDIFFRALAKDSGELAVGVVLSGTGSDGMRGVRAIKEAGGMVMVQDVESAKFDGMPRSALSTGLADYVLNPEKMPKKLISYFEGGHPAALVSRNSATVDPETGVFARVLDLLRRRHSVDFSLYKPNTVTRRLERRMRINQFTNLEDYYRLAAESSQELATLYRELLIGVTSFFRDSEAYQVIREKVLPDLFSSLKEGETLRVWVPGCSTGEEAYSLAMLLAEYLDEHQKRMDVKVFATDVDRDSVEFAGTGVYPASIAADLSKERLARHFVHKGDSFVVSPRIREMVIFATQNVLDDPPFTRIDLLSCRNLLIYFRPVLQKKVLSLFSFALKEGGYLFLGSSESVGELNNRFATVDTKWKTYRNRWSGRLSFDETQRQSRRTDGLRARLAGRPPIHELEGRRHMEHLFEAVIQTYVPTGVAINAEFEPLHVFGDISEYFKIPAGRVSFNLLKMAPRDLSAILSTAVNKAKKTGDELFYRNIVLQREKEKKVLDLRVKPLTAGGKAGAVYLVFLEAAGERRIASSEPQVTMDMDDETRQRISDLEQELQYTRENLQATIEELETSNEELQATNEELLASNEELQSTNEELQSVNEELYTVNSEYQSKIQELTQLNNDMDNLLRGAQIATLFLDREGKIRKFTPTASELLGVLNHDVGRPLEHLSLEMNDDKIIADVNAVASSGQPREREIQKKDGRWFLMRVLPYETSASTTKGVVLTFSDITSLKRAETERSRLGTLLGASEDPVLEVDEELKVRALGRDARKLLGLSGDECVGRPLAEIVPVLHGILAPDWEALLRGAPEAQKRCVTLPAGSHGSEGSKGEELRVFVTPLHNEAGVVDGAGLVLRNVSRQAGAERRELFNANVLRNILESSPSALTVVDRDGNVIFANEKAEEVLSLKDVDITRRTFSDERWEITAIDGGEFPPESLPFARVMATGQPVRDVRHAIHKGGGDSVTLSIDAAPVYGQDEQIVAVVCTLRQIEAG